MARKAAPNWPKGFPSTEHHFQYINWGEFAGRYQSLLGNGLGISQWMLSNYIFHHLSSFGIYFSLFVVSLFIAIIILTILLF